MGMLDTATDDQRAQWRADWEAARTRVSTKPKIVATVGPRKRKPVSLPKPAEQCDGCHEMAYTVSPVNEQGDRWRFLCITCRDVSPDPPM